MKGSRGKGSKKITSGKVLIAFNEKLNELTVWKKDCNLFFTFSSIIEGGPHDLIIAGSIMVPEFKTMITLQLVITSGQFPIFLLFQRKRIPNCPGSGNICFFLISFLSRAGSVEISRSPGGINQGVKPG